jgi:hypothetical protein
MKIDIMVLLANRESRENWGILAHLFSTMILENIKKICCIENVDPVHPSRKIG